MLQLQNEAMMLVFLFLGASALVAPARRLPAGPRRSAKHATVMNGGAAALLGTVAPTLGIFTSTALYAASLPAVIKRTKQGSLGELNPLPTAFVVLSTMAWVQYSLSVKNPFVLISNLPGNVAAMLSTVLMLPLMKGNAQLGQVQWTLVAGTVANLLMWSYMIFAGLSPVARSQILGLYASAFCVILFGSPLSTIAKVIRQRNSASILAAFTFAQVANCSLWAAYGLWAAKDVYVYGPNIAGLALGLAQLALRIIFPASED